MLDTTLILDDLENLVMSNNLNGVRAWLDRLDACPKDERKTLKAALKTNECLVLHHAVLQDNLDMVEALLPLVNLRSKDDEGYTALMRAVSMGSDSLVERLLQEPKALLSSDRTSDRQTPLSLAVFDNASDALIDRLWTVSDRRAKDSIDATLLMRAAWIPNMPLIERLIPEVVVDDQDQNGLTALMHAVHANNLPAVRRLAGISTLSLAGHEHYTALHWAVNMGHLEVLEALLDAGADPHFKSSSGVSAFTLAVTDSPQSYERLLVRDGDPKGQFVHGMLTRLRNPKRFEDIDENHWPLYDQALLMHPAVETVDAWVRKNLIEEKKRTTTMPHRPQVVRMLSKTYARVEAGMLNAVAPTTVAATLAKERSRL